MAASKLKLGFIGGGINSAVGQTHKIASQMDERWVLEAGCFSRDPEINHSTSNHWHIQHHRLYADSTEMLQQEKGKLDAVAILTPTPSHAELVIQAIEQGYAVICEKSLAASAVDAEKIEQAVTTHQGFLAVTYNYTGYPMIRELQQLIQQGEIGKLHQIHIEMPQEGFQKLNAAGKSIVPQTWRLQDGTIPTISLDLGVHLVHMIGFLSGETPLEVMATESNYGNFKGIIDNISCLSKYTGGLSCQLWYSKTALGQSNGLKVRVYGATGSAEWLQMEPEYLILNNQAGEKKVITRASNRVIESIKPNYNRFKAGHPSGFIEAFANYYTDLADSLIEFQTKGTFSSPWIFTAKEALSGLLMLEAMTNSAKNNCWVKIRE